MVNTNSDHAHRRHHRHREVRDRDDPLLKIKFSIPPFAGKYDLDAYLTWEMAIEQKFECYDIPDNKRIRAATSEFIDFASIWWQEYCCTNRDVPTTWEGMKRVTRARFVPSYFSHDLLNKLQCLKQDKNNVEEYYQELQIGMLHCGLEETPKAKMARCFGGLNREIHTILDYKEYNSITRLFHLACKAEREMQNRQRTRGPSEVISIGWPNQRQAKTSATSSNHTPTPSFSNNRVQPTSSTTPTRAPEASKSPAPAPAPSSSSVNSTGRSRDTQCHRCKGYGHMMRDCPSK